MNKNEMIEEILIKEAEERERFEKELEERPLAQYSTSELKEELRRRKKWK